MKHIGTFDIPEWALYALEYGVNENGSLTEEDERLVNEFIEQNFPKGYYMSIDWTDYNEFDTHPAFGKACKTYKAKFYI